jgi:glycine dehydrogenase subunit 1
MGSNYLPNTESDQGEMLERIGAGDFRELLERSMPASLIKEEWPSLPPALSEMEAGSLLEELSRRNLNLGERLSFIGGGAYDHFIPAVVDQILLRSEFYTAYTPYQAEVSQGTLQSIYEFQSLICELTGMEVANASMYDGATAAAEAALLACSHTRRRRVLIGGNVHPHYLQVMRTYFSGLEVESSEIGFQEGLLDLADLQRQLSDEVAAVIIQSPNFLGLVEDLSLYEPSIHRNGALLVQIFDPLSLGIIKTPGEYNVDLAVGEGQPLGLPPSFGGPYLGLMAAKGSLVRRLPGRLSGATTDARGRRGFVLTLQTREQHIRREKATSNICTNQALCALAAAIYLSLMGKEGIREVAELCLEKSHYAQEEICKLKGFTRKFASPFFKEFVIEAPKRAHDVIAALRVKGILPGLDLGRYFPGMENCLMIAVTERRTKSDIDRLVKALSTV